MKKQLDINGIICAFCAIKLKQTLMRIGSVCDVRTLPDKALAYVHCCENVTDQQLQDANENIGYDQVNIIDPDDTCSKKE